MQQLGRALDERGVRRRQRRQPGRCHVVEERTPALEGGRRRRRRSTMTGERLGDETRRPLGIGLDPWQFLRRGQLGELTLEALPGDVATGHVEDADLVVEDQRAETKRAERALEEDPGRAGPGAVDAGEPGSNGPRVAPRDEWTSRRSGGRDRHASLGEAIDDAPGGPAERASRVVGERGEEGKRGRTVLTGEGPQGLFEAGRRRRREYGDLGGAGQHLRRQPVIEEAPAGGVGPRPGPRRPSEAGPEKR